LWVADVNRKEKELESLFAPTVGALGCRIWGVEYLSQGKRSMLRIFIDRDEGVSVEDCERVSKQVSALLDVEDPLGPAYTLEVSSPGLDRLLMKPEHYVECVGEVVDLRLNFAFEGRRHFVGRMVGYEDDEVVIQVEDTEFVFPLENVQRARIVPQFEDNK
jgi:ribosome maturation factor RimP